jgi:hypothetical protein
MSKDKCKGIPAATKLQEDFDKLSEKVDKLEEQLKGRFPSPIFQLTEDVALYEGMFDLLVIKGQATQDEIIHYLDTYKQIWTAVAHLMIDKKVFTARELNCAMLAYHHILRSKGGNSGMSREDLFKERADYIKYLLSLPDPLEALGK